MGHTSDDATSHDGSLMRRVTPTVYRQKMLTIPNSALCTHFGWCSDECPDFVVYVRGSPVHVDGMCRIPGHRYRYHTVFARRHFEATLEALHVQIGDVQIGDEIELQGHVRDGCIHVEVSVPDADLLVEFHRTSYIRALAAEARQRILAHPRDFTMYDFVLVVAGTF